MDLRLSHFFPNHVIIVLKAIGKACNDGVSKTIRILVFSELIINWQYLPLNSCKLLKKKVKLKQKKKNLTKFVES